MQSLLLALFGSTDSSSIQCKQPTNRLWMFGVHHKCGTIIARHLAFVMSMILDFPTCANGRMAFLGDCGYQNTAPCHFHPSTGYGLIREQRVWVACHVVHRHYELVHQMESDWRGVHIIRDPMDVILSGYVYHMHSGDMHGQTNAIRNMNITRGVAQEAIFALGDTFNEMLDVTRWRKQQGANGSQLLVVRLEEMTGSAENYSRTVAKMYKHMVGDVICAKRVHAMGSAAEQYDPKKGFKPEDAIHISAATALSAARKAYSQIPQNLRERVDKVRRELGYL